LDKPVDFDDPENDPELKDDPIYQTNLVVCTTCVYLKSVMNYEYC
jgi:hypothetical protein